MTTLHGTFLFKNQRIASKTDRKETTLLALRGMKAGYSPKVKEKMTYYGSKTPYSLAVQILADIVGSVICSDQAVWEAVQETANEISARQIAEYRNWEKENDGKIVITNELDLYDAETKEMIVEADGILTHQQSSVRDGTEHSKHFVNQLVVLVEKPDGGFETVVEPIVQGETGVALPEYTQYQIDKHYGERKEPLPVVVITDGGRDIRALMGLIFSVLPVIILDWYHICKKIGELMSMTAVNKEAK